jgi:hypothetical protein
MNNSGSSSREVLYCGALSAVAALGRLVRIAARDNFDHFFEHLDDANCRQEKDGGNQHHQHSFSGYDR